LVQVEEAFKILKGDLTIRPIFHQKEGRIEAHIFVAFISYALQAKFGAVQMIDVHLPTTDGRKGILSRYTQPEPELQMLLRQLRLSLPNQPPPRVTANGAVPP
jgi:hypothetical protein